jgi:ribosome-associated protein
MAKWFLSEHTVFLNGEQEQRRGKKLYHEDELEIQNVGKVAISSQQ